jgi:PII-like signaling protein
MLDKNKTGDLPVTISIVDDSNKRRRFIDSKHANASVDEYSIHDV